MAGPIDPRLLRRARATRSYLVAGVAVGSATAILTLGQAWLLSRSVADIFATRSLGTLGWAVAGLTLVFAGKAVLTWLNEWLAHRAAAAVKSQLRRDIMSARLARPLEYTSTGGLITLVTQGLDALDGYFAKYLPQLVLAVTVPLIVGVAIVGADLTSAIILAVTLPLIPVFMALVGWTTEAITRRRWRVQTRLANHFADLVMGLPTLQVFGRAKAQAEGLRRSEAAHRCETMRTLRVSFLSALVLELLATLSVAIIAVTVGFRVVFEQLDLATALFVLILAPEAYLPVRQVGVHYHDAADGMAAADAAFALIDERSDPASPAGAAGPEDGDAPAPAPPAGREKARDDGRPLVQVDRLGHTYPGTATAALAPISFAIHPGEIVALAGASGAGKTTLLNAVMGFLTPSRGIVLLAGRPLVDGARWRRSLAYVGQNPGMISGTVADNVRLGHPGATDADVRQALDRVGAAGLRLEQRVGDEAEGISAGERRRIAVARALLRVSLGGARLLVLDEPTAGLDADTEAGLLATLREVGVAALVVSHRPAVLAAADRVIEVGEAPAESPAADRHPATVGDPQPFATTRGTTSAAGSDPPHSPEALAGLEGAESFAVDAGIAADGSLRSLVEAVPGAWGRLGLALALAFSATGASVALMAVSAWLLSRAAEHPPVLYLQVAALGVRFFGISRGAFRYLERLVGHDIALRLQSALRLETYTRLARTTLLGQRRGDLLSRVIADVEAIQDLVVRVWIPFASSALVLLATSVALAFFSPAAAAVLLVTSILAGLVVPWLASRVSARADAAALPLRGELSDRVHEIARAAADLAAYGAGTAHLDRFTAVDEQLRRASASSAWVRGIANAGQVLAAGTAVVAGLVIGGRQVQQGSLAPVMLAVLALTPLALHEALSTLTQAAQTATRARAALARVREVLDAEPVGSGDRAPVDGLVAVPALAVNELAVGWPGGPVVVEALDLQVRPGEKVALVGPSGVGKTTVAATLLGLIPARRGHFDVQGRVGYLAQDAHIFTTSIAENVKIGNRDASPAQISKALQRAGLSLDPARVVGEAGETLSGGEARRVALARLFVGDYQVLILDEPTEHLDAMTAAALVDDIWSTTTDAPVLVITHDPQLVARCDRSVVLARESVPAGSTATA